MAKIRLKSDNITPYAGLFSIFKQFSSSGLRQTMDPYLGKRGKTAALSTTSWPIAVPFRRKS